MKVKIVNKSAFDLPKYETEGSAGMDLRANIDDYIQILPMERVLIPTGLFIELEVGIEAQIRPRSGMAYKRGICIPNAPGTIDSDYRGEVKIPIINLSTEIQVIERGDRIAQMVIAKYERAEWDLVEDLTCTDRGSGGFGSTGK